MNLFDFAVKWGRGFNWYRQRGARLKKFNNPCCCICASDKLIGTALKFGLCGIFNSFAGERCLQCMLVKLNVVNFPFYCGLIERKFTTLSFARVRPRQRASNEIQLSAPPS